MMSGWEGTAYDMAFELNKPYHSIQPRFSELQALGLIRKTWQVRGPWGASCWKWRLTTEAERNSK